jgi:glutamate carboxypeptidase
MIRSAGLVIAAVLALQTPSPQAERAVVAYIDAHNGEALALLERVVNINSGTQNFAGVREVGAIFLASFDRLGFKTRWVDGAPFQRAGHLIAEHRGVGPKVLLVGHLDTVFERDSLFQKFQRVDEKTATGPGIIDMKGGDVVILQALAALEAAGVLKDLNVTVVMTGDEEEGGRPLAKSREALVAAATGADAAIGFEDGPGDPRYAVTARRGTVDWQLRVKGTPAHSSQIFRGGVRPRRDLRGGASPQRVSREDGGRRTSDLQPGRHPRRNVGRLRRRASTRDGVRQDQCHCRADGRLRRPADAVAGAARSRDEDDAGSDGRRVAA